MNHQDDDPFDFEELEQIRSSPIPRRRSDTAETLKVLGGTLGVIGALLLVMPTVFSWFSHTQGPYDHKKSFKRLLLSTSGALPLGLGYWLYIRGKRLSTPRATEARRHDPRAPILLLRAFSDDHLTYLEPERSFLGRLFGARRAFGWIFGSGMTGTFEELVRKELTVLGPVLAIGRPGETLPPLGAARLWVSNEEWQNRVQELLKECQLVVMILGKTSGEDGLAWEIRHLFAMSQPEKVVLIVPPLSQSTIESRWEENQQLSDGKLPAYRGDELLVTFTPEWKCAVASTKGKKNYQAYEDAFRRLTYYRGGSLGFYHHYPGDGALVEVPSGAVRCPHCGAVLVESEAKYTICACCGESLPRP